MVAQAGGAIDQQTPDAVRADMTEGDRRPSIRLIPLPCRRIVVGVAMTHQARRAPSFYFLLSDFVSHFLKHACACAVGAAPGVELAVHLTSHSFLACAASDPLENAAVGVKALAMARTVVIFRNLAFM
jgi:hypothetical protein